MEEPTPELLNPPVRRANPFAVPDATVPQRVLPPGTMPVIPPEEQKAVRKKNPLSALLGGKQAEIGPGIPSALRTIEDWAPAIAGSAAASAVAPAAMAAGVFTGLGPLASGPIEAGTFAGVSDLSEEAIRLLNKLGGYQVPPSRSAGQRAAEFGTNALMYPVAGKIGDIAAELPRKAFGYEARDIASNAAADEMQKNLAVVGELHRDVGTIAGDVVPQTGSTGAVTEKASRQALRSAKDMPEKSVSRMVKLFGDLTDTEAKEYAESLPASAQLRRERVQPLVDMYGKQQRALGSEFDKLLEGHLKEDVPEGALISLGEQAGIIKRDAQQYAIPGRLRNLIGEAEKWGKPAEPEIPTMITSYGPVPLPPGATSGGKPIVGVEPEKVTPKWEELKRVRDELRSYFDSKHPPTRTTARLLDSAITDAYDAGGLPVNPELNLRYRDHRQRWNAANVRTINNARTPAELSSVVHEGTLGPFLKSRDPADRAYLANLIAGTIRREGLTAEKVIDRFSPKVLRDVFGKGADDVATWARMDMRIDQLPKILNASPELAQIFKRDITQGIAKANRKGFGAIRTKVLSALESLGAPASGLLRTLRKASDEDVATFYLTEMTKPEFGAAMVKAARDGVRLKVPEWKSPGRTSLIFAGGLGAIELLQHGAITSPYAIAVPAVIGAEAMYGLGRDTIIKLIETNGMKSVVSMLDRIVEPTTRRMALRAFARKASQVVARTGLRKLMGDPEEQEAPQ